MSGGPIFQEFPKGPRPAGVHFPNGQFQIHLSKAWCSLGNLLDLYLWMQIQLPPNGTRMSAARFLHGTKKEMESRWADPIWRLLTIIPACRHWYVPEISRKVLAVWCKFPKWTKLVFWGWWKNFTWKLLEIMPPYPEVIFSGKFQKGPGRLVYISKIAQIGFLGRAAKTILGNSLDLYPWIQIQLLPDGARMTAAKLLQGQKGNGKQAEVRNSAMQKGVKRDLPDFHFVNRAIVTAQKGAGQSPTNGDNKNKLAAQKNS